MIKSINSFDLLTDAQVDTILETLNNVNVSLRDDSTVLGPSYAHDKLKQCRDFSNMLEELLITLFNKERQAKSILAYYKEDFRSKKDMMMINDDSVAQLKSAAQRESWINCKLSQELKDLNSASEQLLCVQTMSRAVQLKADSINRTNADIKKQISMMLSTKGGNQDGTTPRDSISDPSFKNHVKDSDLDEDDDPFISLIESHKSKQSPDLSDLFASKPVPDLDVEKYLRNNQKSSPS